jgi:hypothetical protein
MPHPTTPTTTTGDKPKKAPGADSTSRVQEALARAAGEVLMKSKLTPAKKAEVARGMTELGAKFGELAASAWGEPG